MSSGDVVQLILDSLVGTIEPCFGPGTGNVAVKTDTGASLITCNGVSILRHLLHTSIEHPIAQFIVKSVLQHADKHGDGSKRLLLMLQTGWRARGTERLSLEEVFKLRRIVQQVHDWSAKDAASWSSTEGTPSSNEEVLSGLVATVLNEQFAPSITQALQRLVVEWVTGRLFNGEAPDTSEETDEHVLIVPGKSALSSYVAKQACLIQIDRLEYMKQTRKVLSRLRENSIPLCCIGFDEPLNLNVLETVGGTVDENSCSDVTARIRQRQGLLKAMSYRLDSENINIVMSTGSVEPAIIQFLLVNGIVCLPHCSDNALCLLLQNQRKQWVPAEIFWTQPTESLWSHKVSIKDCEFRMFGGKRYLEVQGEHVPMQIILRCQSQAFGEQYADAVRRCIRAAFHTLKNVSLSSGTAHQQPLFQSNPPSGTGETYYAKKVKGSQTVCCQEDRPTSLVEASLRSVGRAYCSCSHATMAEITGNHSLNDAYDFVGQDALQMGFSLGFYCNERAVMNKETGITRNAQPRSESSLFHKEATSGYDSATEMVDRLDAFVTILDQLNSLDCVVFSKNKEQS